MRSVSRRTFLRLIVAATDLTGLVLVAPSLMIQEPPGTRVPLPSPTERSRTAPPTRTPTATRAPTAYPTVTSRPAATPTSLPTSLPVRSSLLDGLVAYWPFEENSGTRFDVSGRGNHLVETNTVHLATGHVGRALYLYEGVERLSLPDAPDLSVGKAGFTIAAWLWLDNLGSKYAVGKYSAGDDCREYLFGLTEFPADRFCFRVSSDGTADKSLVVLANRLGTPALNRWYFVVAWYDPADALIAIQVDNGETESVEWSKGVCDGPAAFCVGGTFNKGVLAYQWFGRIDEVGIWQRALAPAERARLYNGGAGRTYPFS